jgi:D-3-phosphoglycerate dehydrogenase
MPLPSVLVTHPRERLATYFGEQALANLQSVARVKLNPDAHDWSTRELIKAAQDCDVLIAYRQTALDADFFSAVPGLLAAVRCAVDIRTIDVAAASREGILVTQASPGFGPAVAEWVIGVMIDLSRSISLAVAAYWQGQSVEPRMGRELRGACLGIIGYGEIGRHVARLAQAFGMRVCVYDPYVQPSEFAVESMGWHELLACADHLVCLAPATPETDKMINAQALSCMKPSAFFINASRGQLVDEQALLQALEQGMLAGAAMDVGCAADQMPSTELARHPRVIATPHVGGLTPQAIAHQALETVEQTRAILQGRLPNGAVNPAQATRWMSRVST